jgi:hypothetical protein
VLTVGRRSRLEREVVAPEVAPSATFEEAT